jgi:hypothetical protein
MHDLEKRGNSLVVISFNAGVEWDKRDQSRNTTAWEITFLIC